MTTELISQIDSLLALDAKGTLVPHGIGGLARELLERCQVELNTRAAPSPVPDLVRYNIEWCHSTADEVVESLDGAYVLVSEAERIIAAKDDEHLSLSNALAFTDKLASQRLERAKAAEAELASIKEVVDALEAESTMLREASMANRAELEEIGKQVPVALRYRFIVSTDGDWSDWFIVDDGQSVPHRDPKKQEVQNLYANPVVDREAETIERLRKALEDMLDGYQEYDMLNGEPVLRPLTKQKSFIQRATVALSGKEPS